MIEEATIALPVLLALTGTALLTLALFAPRRERAALPVSFAPSPAARPAERWTPPLHDPGLRPPRIDAERPAPPAPPLWPALVDPRLADADEATRRALVEALRDLATPWAEAILVQACRDEPAEPVRVLLDLSARTGR